MNTSEISNTNYSVVPPNSNNGATRGLGNEKQDITYSAPTSGRAQVTHNLRASGPEFEAAVQERQELSYDEPKEAQKSAIGNYSDVANFERRDSIQSAIGIDVYA